MSEVTLQREMFKDLEHVHKMKRRKALDNILHFINGVDDELISSQLYAHLAELEVLLVARLSDDSEINRSKACEILKKILKKGVKSEKMVVYVIPVFCHRIGREPVTEECEDNRLDFLHLIEYMIDVFGVDMQVYINDLCFIFTVCLNDNFPDVVLKVCDCIIKLAAVSGQKFQMFSNSFTYPLLRCISKHRLKVRVKSINTLEYIFVHGDSQDCGEITNKLAKCTLDIPQVRQTLLSFGFALCTKMKERYCFWPTILPLVLLGLRDDDVEIRETAESFWEKIGAQYQEEQEDIESGIVEYHALEGSSQGLQTRTFNFSIGCCTLIQKSFHRMLIHIDAGLSNWQADVRFQAAKLLTVCVAGLRDDSFQYSRKIINSLIYSVNDNDPRITNECLLCAEYLGCVVPPNLYIPLIKPFLWEGKEGSLRIVSALVQSTPPQRLQPYLDNFFEIFGMSNVRQGLSSIEYSELLKILHRLFRSCNFESFETDFFFTVFHIVQVKSCSDDDVIGKETALDVLKAASESFRSDSVENFVADHLQTCLSKLKETPPWNSETENEIVVFYFLAKYKAFDDYLKEVAEILETKINHKMYPLVTFSVLQTLMEIVGRAYESSNEKLVEDWSVYILKEYILKMLSASQGKTGESLRLAAISSLVSILKYSGDANENIFRALGPCSDCLVNLINNDVAETRILACSFIELYHVSFAKFIETTSFFSFIKLLVNRLDDEDVKVRRTSARAMLNSLAAFSKWKEAVEETKELMSSVLIYLVEDDTSVQRDVMEVLNQLGEDHPGHLQSLLETPECEGILERIQNIKKNKDKERSFIPQVEKFK